MAANEDVPRKSSKRVEIYHRRAKTVERAAKVPVRENVILMLQDAATGQVQQIVEAANLVTNEGAEYYAERGAPDASVTYTFNKGKLALAFSYRSTEAATRTLNDLVFTTLSGIQSFDSTYPKTTDSDTDNTGSGVRVVTYRRTYTTSQGNFAIKALGIARHNYTTNPAGSASLRKVLTYITLATAQRITKTSSQTLKVFVNHTFAGV